MAQKAKAQKQTQEEKNIQLLAEIVNLGRDITDISKSLNSMKERKEALLQEAVDRKITRAGDFKLVQKERISSIVDMAAIESMLKKEDFKKIAHVTLKDARHYLTAKQIAKVTSKQVSFWYKVEEIYKPTEID